MVKVFVVGTALQIGLFLTLWAWGTIDGFPQIEDGRAYANTLGFLLLGSAVLFFIPEEGNR